MFDSATDSTYYILSTRFLRQWMEYSGYNDKDPSKAMGSITTAPLPEPFNADIITKEGNEKKLKPDLVEQNDYKIVSKEMMDVFKHYEGSKVERQAIRLPNGKRIVEVYKLVVRCLSNIV